MEFPFKTIVNTEAETVEVSNKFSKVLKSGDIVALNGELGAGKTFFVKQLVKNFKVNNVSSPTFALVNEYSGEVKINHFDFYRINNVNELHDIGFEDYLSEENINLIEWAEMYEEILPKIRYEINIKLNEDFSREILIELKM